MIHSSKLPNYEYRIRHKLARWRGRRALIGRAARLSTERIARLPKLVAPRVCVAIFKLIWNGWCTSHRFQSDGACKFGCSHRSPDKIEHYVNDCSRVKRFVHNTFKRSELGLDHFLLCAPNMSDNDIITVSLTAYAIFTALISLIHHRPIGDEITACDVLRQRAMEAVRNHPKSSKFINNVWSR